jgi:hypothetical protein
LTIDGDAARFAEDPGGFFGHSYQAMHSLPRRDLAALQTAALRMRFAQLRDRVAVLGAMADEQAIIRIDRIDDAAPLLFQHTVYKSYPVSLVTDGRFDRLTRWLDRLTVRDLSGVDVDGCQGIDDWMRALHAQTDLRPVHSSGTTGTMSFLPRTAGEADRMFRTSRLGLVPGLDPFADADERYRHTVWPAFRYGGSAIMQFADYLVRHVAGGEERFHALHPGRMSSDVLFLAGRLRAAQSRGDAGELDPGPALRARKAEFDEAQREMAAGRPAFLARIVERLRGERVLFMGSWSITYQIAQEACEQGLTGVFSADSSVVGGGGAKGVVLPEGWERVIERFTGVPRLRHCYAMSEVMATHMMCARGRYHVEPSTILFLLDPQDGSVLPREGVHTGRAAFFDLLAETYWGGFVTGDEVTVDWSPCACGLASPSLGRSIERYGDKAGGDDKISCAATEGAQREALDFLTAELV